MSEVFHLFRPLLEDNLSVLLLQSTNKTGEKKKEVLYTCITKFYYTNNHTFIYVRVLKVPSGFNEDHGGQREVVSGHG